MNEVYILARNTYNDPSLGLLACYFDRQQAENDCNVLSTYAGTEDTYRIILLKVAPGQAFPVYLGVDFSEKTIPVVNPGAERVAAMSSFCQDIVQEPPSIDENKRLSTDRLKVPGSGLRPPIGTRNRKSGGTREGVKFKRYPESIKIDLENFLFREIEKRNLVYIVEIQQLLAEQVHPRTVFKWVTDFFKSQENLTYTYGRAVHPKFKVPVSVYVPDEKVNSFTLHANSSS